MPDELRGQFALVRRILATFGIPIVEIEGEEADDVIATLARRPKRPASRRIVVTGDLDLLQIVDERTTVLDTRRGITDLGRYDPAAVRERFDLEPAQLPDYRGLKGDPSDNLPGIPGVGEKTAIKLLQAAGSLDALLADPALAGTPKLEALIEQYGEQARICRDVSIVERDLPLTSIGKPAAIARPPTRDLYTLYRELEFKTLLAKLQPPADLPLLRAERGSQGTTSRTSPAVDPPEFAQLADELCALAARRARRARACAATRSASAPPPSRASLRARARSRTTPVREALRALLRSNAPHVAPTTRSASLRALRERGVAAARVRRRPDDRGAPARSVAHASPTSHDAAARFLALDASRATPRRTPTRRCDARADARAARSSANSCALRRRRGSARAGAREDGSGRRRGRSARARRSRRARSTRPRRGCSSRSTTSPAKSSTSARRSSSATILFDKLQIPGGKKNKTGWATGVEVLQGSRASIRSARRCSSTAKSRNSRTRTST